MTRQIFVTRPFKLVLAGAMVAGACILMLALSGSETIAQGGTIIVTTTVDEYTHPALGTGCSLREAVEAINTGASNGGCANPGGTADTIRVPAGVYILTRLAAGSFYTNQKGSLHIDDVNVTILGAGAQETTIRGVTSFDDRVFYIVAWGFGDPDVQVTMVGLTIRGGNTSGDGGGIFASMPQGGGSTLTLMDVILKGNQAQSGGGLKVDWGSNATLRRVTITGNQAAFGGGIYYQAQYGTDRLKMTNVTISNNQVGGSGGGLYADAGYAGAEVKATNVTFANNSASGGSGGNIYNKQSTVRLQNTIVAYGTDKNGATNCAGDPGPNITSLGYNLDSGNTCGLTQPGDQVNTSPMMLPLGDYGGQTPTHALQEDSPARDAIPFGVNGCGTNIVGDQRGVARPQPAGQSCDVGAFELVFWDYLPLVMKRYRP